MTKAVQNHIHLSLELGSAPENAPTLKWGVMAFEKRPGGYWKTDYSLNGTLHATVLTDGSDPITYEDYRCSIYLVAEDGYTFQQRLAQLKAMHGRIVYFVENYHEANGTDHSDSVRLMFVDEVRGEQPTDPLVTHAEIKVSLLDATDAY